MRSDARYWMHHTCARRGERLERDRGAPRRLVEPRLGWWAWEGIDKVRNEKPCHTATGGFRTPRFRQRAGGDVPAWCGGIGFLSCSAGPVALPSAHTFVLCQHRKRARGQPRSNKSVTSNKDPLQRISQLTTDRSLANKDPLQRISQLTTDRSLAIACPLSRRCQSQGPLRVPCLHRPPLYDAVR